jgi:hypothetical protein
LTRIEPNIDLIKTMAATTALAHPPLLEIIIWGNWQQVVLTPGLVSQLALAGLGAIPELLADDD